LIRGYNGSQGIFKIKPMRICFADLEESSLPCRTKKKWEVRTENRFWNFSCLHRDCLWDHAM